MIRHLPIAALLLSTGLIASGARAQEAAPAPAPAQKGGPASLCQELLAFVKKPEEKKQEAVTPASQSTAVSNPSGKSEGQPSASAGSQQTSGLSGPANADAKGGGTGAPSGDAKAGAQADGKIDGKIDGKTALAKANAAAKSPPPPAALAPDPKADEALVAKIETAAAANDELGCRATARGMRVAGFVMPPPLLALSALDPKFFAGPRP